MERILVTGVGGPTPRSFVRAVKWYGGALAEQFDFIGVDANPLAYGLYDRELFSYTQVVPRADREGYWEAINKLVDELEITGAVILPEVEVLEWSRNLDQLHRRIKVHLPDYRLASALVNKHRLHELLQDTSFIPNFYYLRPGSYDYKELTASVGDVFWVRSTEGSSGLGSLKINSQAALDQWLSINPGVTEFIASEYLPGRNMACKLLYFNGKLLRTACAERVYYIMSKVAPSGITGNTSFGRLINEPQVVAFCTRAMETISAALGVAPHGIFTVDLKEDEAGAPKITEINIRHVAFTSSMAAGGANLPLDTLRALFLENPQKMDTIHYQYPPDMIFLRDVDDRPLVMPEHELKKLGV